MKIAFIVLLFCIPLIVLSSQNFIPKNREEVFSLLSKNMENIVEFGKKMKDSEFLEKIENKIGPIELQLISDISLALIKSKILNPIIEILPNINEIRKLLGINSIQDALAFIMGPNFSKLLNYLANIFEINRENWIKYIKCLIEYFLKLPLVEFGKTEYKISYYRGRTYTIEKSRIKYYGQIYKDVRNVEFLNKAEELALYINKAYTFLDSPFDQYMERFAGDTLCKIFGGYSPLGYFFRSFIEEKEDVSTKFLLIDLCDACSKYLFNKFGMKLFTKLLKTILGPACFFIDTFIYSYKFTYGLMEHLFDL